MNDNDDMKRTYGNGEARAECYVEISLCSVGNGVYGMVCGSCDAPLSVLSLKFVPLVVIVAGENIDL